MDSIPAIGENYASPSVKRELVRMYRRNGCHHCGARKLPVIGDHMPPNKVMLQQKRVRANSILQNPFVLKVGVLARVLIVLLLDDGNRTTLC